MAVTLKGNNGTYEGTSEDNKPLDVPVNTEFNELDTGKTYYFDGETWNEEPPCEGGGFTPTAEQLVAMNSGINAEDVEQITTNKNNILLKANTSDVNTATASLQAQIDQIAQAAGTGTADTEIAQARVDNNGVSYTTLKDRIDTQMASVEEELSAITSHTKNIFEGSIVQGNINSSGADTDSMKNYYVRTDSFIPVDTSILQEDSKCYITISWDSPMNGYRIFFYDENKTYIDKVTGSTATEGSTVRKQKFTIVPQTAKYIRFSYYGSNGTTQYTPEDIEKIQVEYGYTQTEYVDPLTAKDETAREAIAASMAVSSVVGNSICVTPIGNINVKLTVTSPPETSATWKVKQFNKNMADYASEATIATNFNDPTWFAVDLPMQKGETYTISYKQEEAVSSATHNEVIIIQGGNSYLAPKNLKSGYVSFKFTAPVTATYSVGIYTYTLSNTIHISQFMVERGYERTEYVASQSRLLQQSLTPSSDTINLSLTPYQGENNITAPVSRGFVEVSCLENSVNAVKRIMAQGVPWEYAAGDIICIGDSLTDGLYAPISVGKIKENYPYYLGRMLNANVLNTGTAGKYPSWFWENKYSEYDFSQYDCVIMWLGTNGGMDINELDTDGTEANCYKKIIEGIKSQKNDILIILGRVFVTGQKGSEVSFPSAEQTNEVIDYCGNYYNLPVIDFSDLTSGGNRLLHNLQNNTHFGKSGNIFIANRICEFIRSYIGKDITRAEFGLLPKS